MAGSQEYGETRFVMGDKG